MAEKRFDEIDLEKTPGLDLDSAQPLAAPVNETPRASRIARLLAFLTDCSLFVALGLALTPLLPSGAWSNLSREWASFAGIIGFLLILSYFYFVGCWVIWGKTIGGAIFEIRMVSEDDQPLGVVRASRRWLATLLSFLTAGIGFAMALLPSARSFPDRFSASKTIRA